MDHMARDYSWKEVGKRTTGDEGPGHTMVRGALDLPTRKSRGNQWPLHFGVTKEPKSACDTLKEMGVVGWVCEGVEEDGVCLGGNGRE